MKTTSKVAQIAGLIAILLIAGSPMKGGEWKFGDLFVAIGNGQYKVFGGDGTDTGETISDGLGGMTRSCTIDSTYHLLTTNYTNTKVVRHAIGHPHDPIGTFSGNGTSFNNDSLVVDGAGNIFAANASGTHAVVKYNPDGTISSSFAIAGDQANQNACGWIDLSANGTTLLYTCEGRSVKRYNVGATGGQLSDFASFTGSDHLFAIQLLPPGDGSGGLLVAAESAVWRLDSTGSVIGTYDWPGEDNWQFLARDPLHPNRFWAGNPTTHNVYAFNINDASVELGPIAVGSGVTGLCTYGGFSFAQPPATIVPAAPSAVFPTFKFLGPSNNTLTVTLNGVSDASTTVTARATVINPAAGASDPPASLPCTKTADGGTKCVVWHLEADPDLPPNPDPNNPIVTADIKIVSPAGTQDANTRLLRNEAEDITTAAANLEADPIGTTNRFSVYTLNQTPGRDAGCFYSSPLPSSSTFKSGKTIPVKIKCDPTAVPDMSHYDWYLNILQFIPGAVPHIVTFKFTGGTPNAPNNFYRCTKSQCVINLDTTSVDAASFLLATFARIGPESPPAQAPPQSFYTEISVTK